MSSIDKFRGMPDDESLVPSKLSEGERTELRSTITQLAMGIAAESTLPPNDAETEEQRAARLGGYVDALKDVAEASGIETE